MNLNIKYSTSTKRYFLTSACSKPYLKVNNISYLPLTTKTTNGMYLKAKVGNQTYRALEYESISTSDTYYTSESASSGMSSTTALTTTDVTRTEAITESVITGYEYLTAVSSESIALTQSMTNQPYVKWVYKMCTTEYDPNEFPQVISTGKNELVSLTYITSIDNIMTNNTYTSTVYNIEGVDITCTCSSLEATAYLSSIFTMTNIMEFDGVMESESYTEVVYDGNPGYIPMIVANYTTEFGQVYDPGVDTALTFSYTGILLDNGSYLQAQNIHRYYGNYSLMDDLNECYTADLRTSYAQTTGTGYTTSQITTATIPLTSVQTISTKSYTNMITSGYSGVSSSSMSSTSWV